MNIILVLYGIGRGGSIASNAFAKHLIKPLEELHNLSIIEVRDNVEFINNPRSSERGRIDSRQFYFKESIHRIVDTNIDPVLDAYAQSRSFTDVHNDEFKSNLNLLKQLYLLYNARVEIQKSCLNPDIVIAIRDDVLLKRTINYKRVFDCIEKDGSAYFTSSFYWNGGVCERFFISNSLVADKTLGRFDFIPKFYEKMANLSYVEKKGLNAEWLMRCLLEESNFTVYSSQITLTRIRLGGRLQHDILLPRPWRMHSFLSSLASFARFKTS